jgi:signal transduction histidine kinase
MQFLKNYGFLGILTPEYQEKVHKLSPEIEKRFYETAGNHSRFQYDAQMYRRDGSAFWGEVSMQLAADETGKLVSVVGIVSDIDERKRSETQLAEYHAHLELMVQELINTKEKAEESDKLKSAFLANMSHEIRTPLNAIVGVLQLLDSNTLSQKDRKDCIKLIMSGSSQLAATLDDIIDISKIDAGQMTLCPVPVQLNQLMSEMETFFEDYLRFADKEHINVFLDDSGFLNQHFVYIDSERFRQVFNNLISNAVKFTDKGYIRFGYRLSSPDLLEFVVEDSGIGLSPEHHEVIFESFRQLELGNNRQYGGAGLGLTITRNLVRLMGGEIWIESAEGTGATFFFTIPYLPIAPEDVHIFDSMIQEFNDSKIQESENSKIESLNSGILESLNKTVLVVEPKQVKFNYYEKLISATGAHVIRVENLQQWRNIAVHAHSIDVVIADASLLDNEELGNIPDLPTALIVQEDKGKYRQFINNKLCTIEVPVNFTNILEILGKYAG